MASGGRDGVSEFRLTQSYSWVHLKMLNILYKYTPKIYRQFDQMTARENNQTD